MNNQEHMKILRKFKECPYEVLADDKDRAKLMAAVDKSIKVLHKDLSRKKDAAGYWMR